MSPRYIVTLAQMACITLPLAEKQATTYTEWLAINQTASTLVTALHAIDHDDTIAVHLKAKNAEFTAALRAIQRRSNAECDGFRNSGQAFPVL